MYWCGCRTPVANHNSGRSKTGPPDRHPNHRGLLGPDLAGHFRREMDVDSPGFTGDHVKPHCLRSRTTRQVILHHAKPVRPSATKNPASAVAGLGQHNPGSLGERETLRSKLHAGRDVIVVLPLQLVEVAVPHLIGDSGIPGIGAEGPRTQVADFFAIGIVVPAIGTA